MTATLINTVIDDAAAYANSIFDDAREMADDAQTIAAGRASASWFPLRWEPLDDSDDFSLATAEDSKPDDLVVTYVPPDSSGIENPDLLPAYMPAMPALPDAPDSLDTSGLFLTPRPEWSIPDFTVDAPIVDTSIALPSAPDVTTPEAPVAGDSGLTVPEVIVPTFDDRFAGSAPSTIDGAARVASEYESRWPAIVATADSYVETWMTQNCPAHHAALATLESRIAAAMEGGSATDESWEVALYDRARVRVIDEQHVAQRAITTEYGKRGFVIPPGAMMSGLARIHHEGARNLAATSAEIAIERARLELQHLQFAMGLSAQLRQGFVSAAANYMQLLLSANGQALDYAKEIGRLAVEVFNQRVELYRLEIARYQLESQVYTVKLESAFAELRVFEAEIAAEKLNIDLDRNAIALFEAKISAERNKIEIYNAQILAVRAALESEAQKIAIYESQVRAYAARVNGKESEYNAYRAAIQGDMSRVEAYQTEVQAYGTRVQAIGTQVDAERGISQSINEFNRGLLQAQEGQIRKYVADIQGESTRVGSNVDAYRAAVAAYSAEMDAKTRILTTRYEKERVNLTALIADAENRIKIQAINVESFLKAIGTQAEVTNASARILGDMASSALSVNNSIVSQTSEAT